MNNQQTDATTIEYETNIVQELTGSNSVMLNDTGWDSRVYDVDDGQYFFKFPRSEKIRGRYTQEIAALDIAANIGIVRVPQIHWRHPANEYFGYKGVPGKILNDTVRSLDDNAKRLIGSQIGNFLQAFHARPLASARIRSVEDEISQFQRFYEPAISTIRQTYTEPEQRALNAFVYDIWPQQIRSLGSIEVLSHGDLHLNNLLFDAQLGLGIIDFGDVARCDESRDLIDLDDPVIEQATLDAYGATELLRNKIAARKPILAIISLTYHIQKQHPADAARYLEMLRTYL